MIRLKDILMEGKILTFYHATLADNLPSIVSQGLVPSEETHWGGDLGSHSEGRIFVTSKFRTANYYGNVLWRENPNRFKPILRFKHDSSKLIKDEHSANDYYSEQPIKTKFEIFVYTDETQKTTERNGDVWFVENTGEWRLLTSQIASAIKFGEWDGENYD